jgi:enamine deaminase RidA (YjgF/YER057c/UK114 family)
MAGTIDARLQELDIALPEAMTPVANYVPYVRSGNLIFVSGQGPFVDGKVAYAGKLGRDHDVEAGYQAARLTGTHLIAQVKAALNGDLDRVKRVVKLTGFVSSVPEFTNQPKVINGCSDLMVEVFGEAGKHSRSAVATPALPMDFAVEIEAIFEVD